ncbi:uncharacterized protein DUF3179 [Natranaerovirga pectinivora]|uniref:Uncharacterized protein DUF3179 n=1 Tax=Natranaerovirga pectinivora TaxID=682400 RepID=A0A4R3MQI5_9FIRM|nr:DUF3179 domain-containing protein [Natranaerovirga pectinivora]TCT17152.1 uncharacterized protein DUF3179 [Natranaerovirga pectinivora]
MDNLNKLLNYHIKRMNECKLFMNEHSQKDIDNYEMGIQKYKYHMNEYEECLGLQLATNPTLVIQQQPILDVSGITDLNINWTLFDVPLDELIKTKGKDVHPYLFDPKFLTIPGARRYIDSKAPVLVIQDDDEAKAYPLQILLWHGAVNDVFNNRPIVISYSGLTNNTRILDRDINGITYTFGTPGILRNSVRLLYDLETESIWDPFTGRAIVGHMTGEILESIPSNIVPFSLFAELYPSGLVLSPETGYIRRYLANPYIGYDTGDEPLFFLGEIDRRFPTMERVVGISIGDTHKAYPYPILIRERVVEDVINDTELVIFYKTGMISNMDTARIEEGRDVGYTGVFSPYINGEKLTFYSMDNEIYDEQTNSRWNLLGIAEEGPLEGEKLEMLIAADVFWFSWAAYFPDTEIYT